MAATPYGCCSLGYLLLLSALAGCFGSGSALQVDCVVSPWSAWTACSKTCGEGAQGRTRMINTESQGEGSKCPALSDSQACNTECCPVSCSISLWSAWGACSKSCGSGTRSRSRSVTTPASCGGAGCPAGQCGSESCNTAACPDPRLIMIGGSPSSSVGRLVETFPPSSSLSIPSLPQKRFYHSVTLLPGPPARLVVCGGGGSGTRSSCISYTSGQEAWQETFPPSSSLSIPSLPQGRQAHSVTLLPGPPARLVVCGGGGTGTRKSCIFFTSGLEAWQQYYTLKQERWFHSAARIGPDIMILGGQATAAITTAEIVPGGGQFDLQHDSSAACAIAVEDTGEVVLTGGGSGYLTPHGHVSRYSSTGFLGSLPDLRQKRSLHACGAFKTQGLTVLLVTGGNDGPSPLSTTELLDLSTPTTWTLAAPLPHAVSGLSGASLAGGLYVAGGYDGRTYRDEVLRYVQEDGEDDRWEEVGRMADSREYFAMVEGNMVALSP